MSQACCRHEMLQGITESHREHLKHELGRQSSLKMVCITRVPLTPLSRATSHRRRHDVWEAIRAAGAADVGRLDVEDKSILKSECKMSSLLLLIMSGAFTGFERHLARTQVSSLDSNILHCWTMDVS